jgi:PAS domain S-box-containing protein
VPARSPFDLLVAAVRLLLAIAIVGAAAIVAVKLARAGGPAALLATIRSSFYRKLLAILLLASVVPLVGFALFLRGYLERRVEARFTEGNAGVATAVRRVVADYAALRSEESGGGAPQLNDAVLSWLRGVVGQEIHLYQRGVLEATSKPELFASGLLLPRLPGEVQRALVEEGLPYLVRRERLGPTPLPVAYARVDLSGPDDAAVVAVPLVVQQRDIRRAVERVGDMLMLSTVLLTALLATAAAYVARNVARPVRGLAAAAARIARGDYGTRLAATSGDEIAALVGGFNAMAEALAAQRADLERRRDYMEALLGNATTGVVSTDAEGRIVTVNAAAATLIGAVGGELAPGGHLLAAVERLGALAPLADALRRTLPPRPEPQEVDLVVDGGARRLRLVRAALPDPLGGPPGVLHIVDDVTDLMRSNQLAAWAEMARAIAHEIKNPLTPIQLSTEHLQRMLRDRGVFPAPDIEACLDTVLKQVRSLREIAAEFGAYAKLPALSREIVAPEIFLRDVVAAYRSALPLGVVLDERYAGAPQVAADRRVLSRAVVNLVENALQAMPSGGTLTLACGTAPDGGAEISVSDSGSGLDAQVRARIFEPYFSTKSSGTGLGLAIVRRAVEAHGGRIEFESVAGRGTTFRITLPPAPAS